MGSFDVDNYRRWASATWPGAHLVGPGRLGCPFVGSAQRVLPKGACGIIPYKAMHDDNNGTISPSLWTNSNMTEPASPTLLVFVINGCEISVRVSALRWLMFMGYIPHETRPASPEQTCNEPRLHHSAFVKPDAEHMAAHIFSMLSCYSGGGPWKFNLVHRLRSEAFSGENLQPILVAPRQGSIQGAGTYEVLS
jgi:hypothetical protein